MNSSIIKRIIIVVGLTSCPIFNANAQDASATESQHLLRLSTGLSNHMVRDDIISPLIYRGNQFPILFAYDCRSLTNRYTITAYYDNLELTSPITDRSTLSHFAENTNVFIEYSHTRKAFGSEQLGTEGFLGGRVSGFLNWRTFYYSKQRNELSLEAMINLSLDALLETKLDKSSGDFLSFHFCVPVLSYVLPDDRYNAMVSDTFEELDREKDVLGQILTKGKVVTFTRLFKVRTELSYTMFISRSIGCEFQYRFLYYSFMQHKSGSYARCVSNQFLVGLTVAL